MVQSVRSSQGEATLAAPETGARRLIKVQRTLFAGPTLEAPDDLYSGEERGAVVRERHRMTLARYASATTNTYFGRFPASYWQRWTSAGEVVLRVVVSGSGVVRLMACDSDGGTRTAAARRVTGENGTEIEFAVALDRFADGGTLWLEAETADGELVLQDAGWFVTTLRPRRATAVVICTYNRVEDCLRTLETLGADREVSGDLSAVYVVDQGTDSLISRPELAEVQELFDDRLRYIRQPNLGGAGGFTRGMYEALRNQTSDGVNVLLMDDDIRLEPDTVLRLRGLADRADEPTLVGGQMLNLLHPSHLHVGAETANLATLRAGQPVPGALTDADVTLKEQHLRVDAAYNAWWTCLIPSEVVEAIGYPLPLFFQWDDIEYGLRARAAGFPTVTLAGAGVWHADFTWKNWDDWSRYFSFRNSLITSALHSDFPLRDIIESLTRQLLDYLVSMRYGLAVLLICAVEDFLKGPVVLADGGAEASAQVRTLWSQHPETAIHPAHSVPDVVPRDRERTADPGAPSMPRSVLAKRILWQLLRKPTGTATISAADANWWHVALFATAVVTDPSQSGVRVRRFDRDLMLGLARRGAAVLWRLRSEGPAVRKEYLEQLPALSSREQWSRLLDTP